MYKFEKKSYGYRFTLGGFMKADEMKKWLEESKELLKDQKGDYAIFADMRTLKPLPAESQPFMQEGQKYFKAKGMVRSAVVLDSVTAAMQFKRIGKGTGVYAWERYTSADDPNWESIANAWVKFGTDPDA